MTLRNRFFKPIVLASLARCCATAMLLMTALLYLCTLAPARAQSTPEITAGFVCHPGSEGSVAGVNFGANLSVTVSINTQPVGLVTTEDDGRLFFLIHLPTIALSDTYTVAVSTPLSATASSTVSTTVIATDTFVVSYAGFYCVAARTVDENGMIIEPQSVFLPDWAYHQFLPWVSN